MPNLKILDMVVRTFAAVRCDNPRPPSFLGKRQFTMALSMWDGSRANELQNCLWDAAIAIDPTVKGLSERRKSYGSAEALSGLLKGAGLTDIEVTDLTMPCPFSSFDELWQRYLVGSGAGPTGVYVAGLTEDRCEAVKQRLRQDVLREGTDGPFTLRAKAWAVRSLVP
jgi:hypothetical protein